MLRNIDIFSFFFFRKIKTLFASYLPCLCLAPNFFSQCRISVLIIRLESSIVYDKIHLETKQNSFRFLFGRKQPGRLSNSVLKFKRNYFRASSLLKYLCHSSLKRKALATILISISFPFCTVH